MPASPDHWRTVERLYHEALAQPVERRAAFLMEACADDEQLRREVESLLARGASADTVFTRGPAAAAAGLVSDVDRSISSGRRLGGYQILGPIGAGGMGEVYRARDTKLGREVAIKILPRVFTKDPERLRRFEREARMLAALNHPNIAAIYGAEEIEGVPALVLELVEGPTLADRMATGPIPLENALQIARQIADALDAAHDKGIVHRDLKPANIKITPNGVVKVLDFGLAKAATSEEAIPDLTHSPTVTVGGTREGVILGTAAYMSPEQARGLAVDKRTDIWAFGCVLFEMLTGHSPFKGDTTADLIVTVLTQEPDWRRLPENVPPSLRRFLQSALSKSLDERARGMTTLRLQLDELSVSLSTFQTRRSIAVLPFTFLNDVQERQALSLGFADALITTFGNVEDLSVAPTSAILRYGPDADPRQVSYELGVQHVLQGVVQKIGGQWRVSIQIFDPAARRTTFSEKYDFRMEDVFELQDEIGRRVAAALESRFATAAPKARDRYSSDPEAYAEFMLGLRTSYEDAPDAIHRAAEHLSRAVARDPDFALAHAWLSHVCMQIQYYFDADRMWLQRAEQHCERALALDPAIPEGHWARAAILWSPAYNFRHGEAIAELERALTARPNFDRAYNRLATVCMHIGRFREAHAAHERAIRANPNNPTRNGEWLRLYSGAFAEAEVAAEAWLREAPGNWSALWFGPQPPLMLGQLDLAGERIAQARDKKVDEPLLVSLQGMLHARRGERDTALGCVRQALDVPLSFGHAHHTYYQVACVYAVLGDSEKAFAWLERSTDTGNACWPFFRVDPHLENLHSLPRFQRLVERLERDSMAVKIRPL
jgi:serine/threonine protein kinase/tetratricopeptide (TPR) repeat protein